MKKVIKVALSGNPNTGKSSLFSELTGVWQHIGNWPGKTVMKKTAKRSYKGYVLEFVDLPGTYSLSPKSLEETVARDFLVHDNPDVVIDVVDATNLERNLYLTLQVLEITPRVVVALNKFDVVEKSGMEMDVKGLEEMLGVPVVPVSAFTKEGIEELLERVVEVATGKVRPKATIPLYDDRVEELIKKVERLLDEYPELLEMPRRWVAARLTHLDTEVLSHLRAEKMAKLVAELRRLGCRDELRDVQAFHLYGIASSIARKVVKMKGGPIGYRLDKWLERPYIGLPALVGVFLAILTVTFEIGGFIADFLEMGIGVVSEAVSSLLANAPEPLAAFIVEGIIPGLGTVISFFPIIFLFFFLYLSVEDSGYFARAAVMMDRITRRIGLSGRAFLPVMVAYGCNVPAVIGTRILSKEERIKVAILSTLIPCEARLIVTVFFAGAFFSGLYASLAVFGVYMLSLLLFAMLNLAWGGLFKARAAELLIELPPYQVPHFKAVLSESWLQTKWFFKKAGTVILTMTVIIWFLLSYPWGVPLDATIGAQLSGVLTPITGLMGLDWRLTLGMVSGIVAKETLISTLAVVFNTVSFTQLQEILRSSYTIATALALMVSNVVYIPCISTMAVIRQETGSWRWTAFSILLTFSLATVLGIATYHLVSLFIL